MPRQPPPPMPSPSRDDGLSLSQFHFPSRPTSHKSHTRSQSSYSHSNLVQPHPSVHATPQTAAPSTPEPLQMEILQRITFGLLGRASIEAEPREPRELRAISGPSALEPSPKKADKDSNTFGKSAGGGAVAALKRFGHRATHSVSQSQMTEAQAEVLAYNSVKGRSMRGKDSGLGFGSDSVSSLKPKSAKSFPHLTPATVNNNNNSRIPVSSNTLSRKNKVGEVSVPNTPTLASPSKSSFFEFGNMSPERAQPCSPESVKRQRSFLRSITNHTSLTAIRNRTWRRKDIPVVSLDEVASVASSSGHGHGATVSGHAHSGHAHSGSIRGFGFATIKGKGKAKETQPHQPHFGSTPTRPRLRRSIKRSQSIPGIDAVPPLPSPPIVFANRESTDSGVTVVAEGSNGTSLLRKALQSTAILHRSSPSTTTVTPDAPVLPPLPVTTPFLRRAENKAPTEVGLEFGITPSPQSDKVLRRPAHFPSTHRRHKSESASARSSVVSSAACSRSPSAEDLPALPDLSAEYSCRTPRTPPKYTMAQNNTTPTHAGETEESLADLGSFEIATLDRLFGPSGPGEQETLAPSPFDSPHSRSSMAATDNSGTPTKHTRHRDVFALTGASTPTDSVTSASAVTADYRSVHSTDSESLPDAPPSIYVPPSSIFQAQIQNDDVSSVIDSDIGDSDSELIAFRTDASRYASLNAGRRVPIGLGLLDIEVGVSDQDAASLATRSYAGSQVEELRDESPTDSGVSSPLETDINTPTDVVRPGSLLGAEHDRQWAAFANLPDESDESIRSMRSSKNDDFQPVTDDEEQFLSSRGAESSLYDPRRDSVASEDEFGQAYNWGCTSLSTIAEVSYSTNAMSMVSVRHVSSGSVASMPPGRTRVSVGPKGSLAPQDESLERTTAVDMLEMLDTELGASRKENAVLRDRILELEYSLDQARTAMATNEATVDNLQTSHTALENECEALRTNAHENTAENSRLSAALREVKDMHALELSERDQALALAHLELNTKDAEVENLLNELDMAKFAATEARVMGTATRKELEAMSLALSEAVSEQDNAWKTAGFFKEELEVQAAKFVQDREALSAWEAERDMYDKRLGMLQKELEISDRKLNIEEGRAYRAEEVIIPRLEERIESLTLLLREATEGTDEGDLSNSSIRSQETTVNVLIDQETDLIALRRAVDSKGIELDDITYQFERHKRTCIRDIADMREDATSLKDEIKGLKTELRGLREAEETHRGRAADYFQRNKSCLAELDRLNLIASQRMVELTELRAQAAAASGSAAALGKRVAQLETERAALEETLKEKEFELSMVKRQVPSTPTPQRMKRSISRAVSHSAHSVHSAHSPRPAPLLSPAARKLRPKRVTMSATASPEPSTAFPGESAESADADVLTPTTKHNSDEPVKIVVKKRTPSTPQPRRQSVLLARASGIPIKSRKEGSASSSDSSDK